MRSYTVIESILKDFLENKITLVYNEFRVDGKSMEDLDISERRKYGTIISKAMVMLAILKRLMVLKFDMLASGDKKTPIIIGAGYVIDTVAKDIGNEVSSSDIHKIVNYICDDSATIIINSEEYESIHKLIKELYDAGVYTAKPILSCIENKRLNDDEVEPGVRHLYTILAKSDDLLGNFSCEGHIEYTYIDGELKFILDPPSIMIDFSPKVKNITAIVDKITPTIEHDLTKNIYLMFRESKSITNKTWDNRVMVSFKHKIDEPIMFNEDDIDKAYHTLGMLHKSLTVFCKQLVEEVTCGKKNI